MITDEIGNLIRVNEAFTRITGYTPDEVIGKNPRILTSGRQDAAFYEAMWASINCKGAWEGEIWNRRKNGEIYPEHLTITAVKDAHGIAAMRCSCSICFRRVMSSCSDAHIDKLCLYFI